MTATTTQTPAGSYQDLVTQLLDAARIHPEGRALVGGRQTVTWEKLARRMDRVAAHLQGLGLEPGDRVGIVSTLTPVSVTLLLGALRAGACVVPMTTLMRPEAIVEMLVDAGVRVLGLTSQLLADLAPYLGRLESLVPGGGLGLDFAATGWTQLRDIFRNAELVPRAVELGPEHPCNIIYSSGTTGTPKGILHSHRMRAFQVERMAHFELDSDATVLLSTPLGSNTTQIALLPALARGATVVLQPSFQRQEYLELAARYRVTHTILVPIQLQRLMERPEFDATDLRSFRVIWCTGAHMTAARKQEILQRWPGRLIEIYGQTEGGCTTLLDATAEPDHLDSVGRPAPGVEVRILDEDGRVLPSGQTGEIVGRAVSMMTGYWGRPDLTQELTWRDEEERAFYRTGDLGWLDADGFLHLAGRKKDIIISGGFNIHAEDLEEVLSRHPAVAEVAVIGIPSQEWGETPLALVVLREGLDTSAAELRSWANQRLSRVQWLTQLELRAELPRTPQGKVRKEDLRAPYWQGH